MGVLMKSRVLATTLLLAALAVPVGGSAQEPEWVLDAEDPTGDLAEGLGLPTDSAIDPARYADWPYFDIVGLRIGIDGDDLVAVFDLAGDVPAEPDPVPATGYHLSIDRTGDGLADIVATTEAATGWDTYVTDLATFLPLRTGKADVDGRTVTLRLPLTIVGSSKSLRVQGQMAAFPDFPEWAVGLQGYELVAEAEARGLADEALYLTSWVDGVPGGVSAWLPLDDGDALAAAIAENSRAD